VTAIQSPALITVKVAAPTTYSTVGQNITYTYNVTNSGNVGIAGPINVTDNTTGTKVVTSGNLNPGQSVIGTANYIITQADLNNGSVTNAAFATGTFNGTQVTSNTASTTVTAAQGPALTILKSASPTTYSAVGQNITYNYNVTNSGNVVILGPINVTDNRTGTIHISNNSLAPGQSIIGTTNYTITQTDINNGSVTNAAFVTGKLGSNTITSNNVAATVTAVILPLAPVANFSANVTSGCAPLTVQFTDLSTNATGWNWNFGDGTNSTLQNPMHTYSTAGNYTVNLTVSNANGTNSKLATINVSSPRRKSSK